MRNGLIKLVSLEYNLPPDISYWLPKIVKKQQEVNSKMPTKTNFKFENNNG